MIARSTSSVETVSGGAMRHTEPRSGRRRMFIDRPSSKAALGCESTQCVVWLARMAIFDEFDAKQQAISANITDDLMLLLQTA